MSDSVARAAAKQYRGVHWDLRRRKFVAQLRVAGKLHHVGCFGSAEQAARAFDNKLRKMCKSNLLRLKRASLMLVTDENLVDQKVTRALLVGGGVLEIVAVVAPCSSSCGKG